MSASNINVAKPPFKCPPLPSNAICDFITKCSTIASQNGFLINYQPKPKFVEENNLKYYVCLAENLANKPTNNPIKTVSASNNVNKKRFDPFAGPFKIGAHICDLGTHKKYKLILNKFPVLPHHILIISSDWIKQTILLNSNDFDITYNVYKSLLLKNENKNGFIFFNSGILSGATQMHRHLHIITPKQNHNILLNQIGDILLQQKQKNDNINDQKQNDNDIRNDIMMFDGYSFLHGIVLLNDINVVINGNSLHKYYSELLKWIKDKMSSNINIDNNYLDENQFSYNLLINQNIMMIIPRKYATFTQTLDNDMNGNSNVSVSFPINALPFAGLIFCNSDNAMKLYNKVGINTMIKYCTFTNN